MEGKQLRITVEKYHGLGNDYLIYDPNKNKMELNPSNVQLMCNRNFGVGADGVLEGPVTWTEGDWTYEADATLRSGVLELELTMSSRLPADQLPSPVKLRRGLSADGEPLHNAVHTITPYSVADAGEGRGYPRYPPEQGYQTTATTRPRCTMVAPPPEVCPLHVSALGVQGGVLSLPLIQAYTLPTLTQRRYLDKNRIQTIIQIFTKTAVSNRLCQVHIRCGNNTYICFLHF